MMIRDISHIIIIRKTNLVAFVNSFVVLYCELIMLLDIFVRSRDTLEREKHYFLNGFCISFFVWIYFFPLFFPNWLFLFSFSFCFFCFVPSFLDEPLWELHLAPTEYSFRYSKGVSRLLGKQTHDLTWPRDIH